VANKNDELSKALLAVLGIPVLVVLIFIAMIPFALWSAWVEQKLYGWFLLPIKGFPHLNLWWVYGITLLIGALTYSYQKTDKDAKVGKEIGAVFGRAFGLAVILLVGYLIKGHIHG
jgi:hypothetical protein